MFSVSETKRPVVILTGASTGLGLELAKQLVQKDIYHVVLTARHSSLYRLHEQSEFEGSHVWIRTMDVTNRYERERVVDEVLKKFGRVDFLINNAGVAYRTVVEHIEPRELMRQMTINLYAPLSLMRLVLPSMRKKGSGHIINISSVSGMLAMPTMGLYSASKFSLEAISESLWYEVRPWNVNVTLVEPGFIKSEALNKVPWSKRAQESIKKKQTPYHVHYKLMEPFVQKIMDKVLASPVTVARKITKLMERKKPPLRYKVTFDAVLFALIKRIFTDSFYHKLLYRLLPKVKKWGREGEEESMYSNFLLTNRSDVDYESFQYDFVDIQ